MKVWLVLLSLLVAGCASSSDTAETEGPLSDGTPDEQNTRPAPDRTVGVDLVSVAGSTTMPGNVPISFQVTHDKVEDITWTLTAAPNFLSYSGVIGLGCTGSAWGTNAEPHSSTYGQCPSLSRGNYTIEVSFTGPVAYWDLQMVGETVVNDTASRI